MSTDPAQRTDTAETAQIRADIEATRADLADTIDELAERTDPRRILRRRLTGVRDRIVDLAGLPLRVLPDRLLPDRLLPDRLLPGRLTRDRVVSTVGDLTGPMVDAVRTVPGKLWQLPGRVLARLLG